MQQHLGNFLDEVDAARAYDRAARHLLGERAITNVSLGLLPKVSAMPPVMATSPDPRRHPGTRTVSKTKTKKRKKPATPASSASAPKRASKRAASLQVRRFDASVLENGGDSALQALRDKVRKSVKANKIQNWCLSPSRYAHLHLLSLHTRALKKFTTVRFESSIVDCNCRNGNWRMYCRWSYKKFKMQSSPIDLLDYIRHVRKREREREKIARKKTHEKCVYENLDRKECSNDTNF